VIEDRTFGLKNKNKSAKVQKFINQVETGVKNQQNADANKAKESKLRAKAAKQQQEEELRLLLNEGVANQFGKKKSKAKEQAEAIGLAESAVTIEFDDSDSDDDYTQEDPVSTTVSQPVYEEVEVEAVEVFKEKTLEDIIEEQRAKLAAQGKTGTPVTAETFAIWRAHKLAKRQADAEARMKAEQGKKKGGKGLSVLSGKELFNYNSALFVDDEGAADDKDAVEYYNEQKAREEREEALQRAAAKKAQEEQERLFEIHKLEIEQKVRDEEARRKAARTSTTTFVLDGVTVKTAVFDNVEREDLSFFAVAEAPTEEEERMANEEAARKLAEATKNDTKGEEVKKEDNIEVNEELFGGDDDLDDLDDEDA